MFAQISFWLLLMSAWALVELSPMSERETVSDIGKPREASFCPEGYTLVNRGCYYFSNISLSWYDAYAYCQKENAHLATPSMDADNVALKNYLTDNFAVVEGVDGWWFGGTDSAVEGHWVWISDLKTIVDRDWCDGDPNNDNGEHCVSFNPSCEFSWNDRSCNFWGFRFICETYTGTREYHALY